MSVRSAYVKIGRDGVPVEFKESPISNAGESLEPRSPAVKGLRNAAGLSLLVLGAVGIVLPIVPGVPLLVAAVALLGQDHPLVRSGTRWIGVPRDLAVRLGRRFSWGRAADRGNAPG